MATATAQKSITIREADVSDLCWILPELKKFSASYGTKLNLTDNEPHAVRGLENMIREHVFLVAERDGLGVGLIAGYLVPHNFNPDIIILGETFWWVAEDHRKSRAGLLLLREFVKIGKARANWVTVALEHNSPVNPYALEKRGFHLQERNYLMEVL